jgi:hypothetical protein
MRNPSNEMNQRNWHCAAWPCLDIETTMCGFCAVWLCNFHGRAHRTNDCCNPLPSPSTADIIVASSRLRQSHIRWDTGHTWQHGMSPLIREWNPLRQWRAANGVTLKRFAEVVGVSQSWLSEAWEVDGIPHYRVRLIGEIIQSPCFEEAHEKWREWKSDRSRVSREIAIRARIRQRKEAREIRTSIKRTSRVDSAIQHDQDVATQWLREHETQLKDLRLPLDWKLTHAFSLVSSKRDQDDGAMSADRLYYAAFRSVESGNNFISLEDYVIEKIDHERDR